MKRNLLRSNLSVTPEGLMSITLFLTLVSALVTLTLVALLLSVSFQYAWFLLVCPAVVFTLTINYPSVSQSSRNAGLENELPFLVGFMAILAGGGESVISVLRRVSTMKIFPVSSKEAYRILADVDIYGLEPVLALERASRNSPNKWFAELLSGYSTVLKTGGDYVNFLNVKLREIFDERTARIKRASEITGSFAEIYLIIVVVLGITIFTLFLVQTFLVSSTGGLSQISFFAFVIVPVVSAAIIWVLDAAQPKWPYTDYRAYRVFILSIPIGVIFYFLPVTSYGFVHLSLALVSMSMPAAYFATKYSQERRGIERMLPEFIADVAEGRKIGLSPEASIERLYSVQYGRLTPAIHKMASQLTWGFSIRRVLRSFTFTIHSWVAQASGTLMLEVIEVGGGTVRGFSEMADFTRKISQSETEARSSLRAYTMIAYISSVMIVATTFVFVYFLSQGSVLGVKAAVPALKISPSTVDLLFTAAIFEGWVIGITAGKMGEGSIAEGFKHAIILVLVTILTIVMVGTFFPIPL